MPMFGQPAGLLAAGSGGQGIGSFGRSLAGVMQAFGNDASNSQSGRDRELEQIIQIGKLEYQVQQAEQAQREKEQLRQQEIGQKLAQQGQAEELRGQIPQQYQELFDVDQKTAIARAFPEAQDPTSLQQNLMAGGLQPGTPEFQQAILRDINPPDQGTALAQNLQAAGLRPGTLEFQQAMLRAVNKPAVSLKQEGSIPAGHRAVRDAAGNITALEAIAGGPADPARPTTEQRNKLSNAEKTYRQLTGQIANYAKTIQGGVTMLPGKERDKLKAEREQIKLQLKNLYELGAITGPDEEILDNLIFDPTSSTAKIGGMVPGMESAEERALSNLQVLITEADRAMEAASGNNPKAFEAPSLSSMSNEELLAIIQGGQ